MRKLLMVSCVVGLLSASSIVKAQDNRVHLRGVIAEVGDQGIVLHARDGNVDIFVTEDTHIFRNGERVRLGDLQRGDRAGVLARRTDRGLVALLIRAKSGEDKVRLKGIIAEVGDRGIVLHTRDGNVDIFVTEDTRIFRNGKPAELGDLQPRDRAGVLAKRTDRGLVALLIRAKSRNDSVRLKGVIAEVGDRGIVLHTRDGNVDIFVTEDTRIFRNGEPAELGDLQPRDRAKVLAKHTDDGLVAKVIAARGK